MNTNTKIAGLPPHEYAGLWGSTDADGVYFYNYGAESCEKTAKWLKGFVGAIERLIVQVEAGGEGANKPYDKGSAQELKQLLAFVQADYQNRVQVENVIRACGVPV